jgi:hypothetical protein
VNYRLAQALSILFQPLLMPSFLFLLLWAFAAPTLPSWDASSAVLVFGLVFLTTCLIPLISLLALKVSGNLSGSFFMKDRQQRIVPFVFISLYYVLTAYLFTSKLFFVNELLIACITVVAALIVLLTLITFFWKISAHSMAMGGSVGVLVAVQMHYTMASMLWPLLGMVVLAGAVMTARLYLKAHDAAEVWVGFGVGFLFCFFGLQYLL